MSPSSPAPAFGPVIGVAELAHGAPIAVALTPDAATRAAIAAELGLIEIGELGLDGTLEPEGRRDWRLTARLTARVVQSCVVTLAPVPAAIDEPVRRRFLADWHEPEGAEVELPDDVDTDPIGAGIDLGAVLVEALALALPPYPHAQGAHLDTVDFTEPGKAAMTDDDARPFAGLAALRDKLTDEGDDS